MKKIFIILAIVLTAFNASAEFRWGPTAGVNISQYKFKQPLISVGNTTGFNVGIIGELMFPGIGLGVDIGLGYEMHGSKIDFGQKEVWASDGYGNELSTLHTIQIPINLCYKYTNLNGIEQKIAPFVYAGPVFSILAGHNKLDALEYSHGSLDLQCGLGAEIFKSFQISGGYYWGMTYEVRTVKLDNFSARARGWNIRLTYLF